MEKHFEYYPFLSRVLWTTPILSGILLSFLCVSPSKSNLLLIIPESPSPLTYSHAHPLLLIFACSVLLHLQISVSHPFSAHPSGLHFTCRFSLDEVWYLPKGLLLWVCLNCTAITLVGIIILLQVKANYKVIDKARLSLVFYK